MSLANQRVRPLERIVDLTVPLPGRGVGESEVAFILRQEGVLQAERVSVIETDDRLEQAGGKIVSGSKKALPKRLCALMANLKPSAKQAAAKPAEDCNQECLDRDHLARRSFSR
jgi:hypothetical protein